MKKHLKTWTFYGVMMLLFVVLTYVLFSNAAHLETTAVSTNHSDTSLSSLENFRVAMLHNIMEPAAMLLLQIISILLVSRIFGYLFVKIGQPTVIGEILAGIVLGPSLLGYFFPEAYHFLFTPDSLSNIYILSEIGLVLFMFVIGMELDLSALKNKMGATFVISQASIVIPYFMGMWLAYYLYEEFAAAQTDFMSFALFIGISMSITAFPVLARIVQERGLTKSHLGTISPAGRAKKLPRWRNIAL